MSTIFTIARRRLRIFCRGSSTCPTAGAFLLEDGVSVGALFELTPVGTEARTRRRSWKLTCATPSRPRLTEAVPELVVRRRGYLQLYVQDEPSLSGFNARRVQAHLPQGARKQQRVLARSTLPLLRERTARASAAPVVSSRTPR